MIMDFHANTSNGRSHDRNTSAPSFPQNQFQGNAYYHQTYTPKMDSQVMRDMSGGYSPWQAPEFPLIVPSASHVVLYQVGRSGFQNAPPTPRPSEDKWDSSNVKMPYSDKSLYNVLGSSGVPSHSAAAVVAGFSATSISRKRWALIKNTLNKPIRNSRDLVSAILQYNAKFAKVWKFDGLHRFFNQILDSTESNDFFTNVLPQIIDLVLKLPHLVQAPIPLLKKNKNMSISMSQVQIASLLANAFFCTYPRRNTTNAGSEYESYPMINFNEFYEPQTTNGLERLRFIINYLKRVSSKKPIGVITFSRRSVQSQQCPNWQQSDIPIKTIVPVHIENGLNIETTVGIIQVDFDYKTKDEKNIDEQIRYYVCPELMVAKLFVEELEPNETLIVIGCERYSNYKGEDIHSIKFNGDHVDRIPRDTSGRRRRVQLAIDVHSYQDNADQYYKTAILKELNKAWVGFSFCTNHKSKSLEYPGVATGSYGCGSKFKHSRQLRFLIQVMACTQARRPLNYATFSDGNSKERFVNMLNLLQQHNVSIGKLFKLIKKYRKRTESDKKKLFSYITHELENQTKSDAEDQSDEDGAAIPAQPNSSTKPKRSRTNRANDNKQMGATHADVSMYIIMIVFLIVALLQSFFGTK